MKAVYRILLTVVVFAGALIYFGYHMPEHISSAEIGTTHMSEAMMPYLTLSVNEQEINLLHGYSSSVDAELLYETVTPIDTEQILDVLITENENTIKKFQYEITTIDGDVVEEGTIHALEHTEDGRRSARVRIGKTLATDTEYRLNMTLVNSQSRKYYYYTTLKVYKNSHLNEHLNFAVSFHKAMFSKEEAEEYRKYMESRSSSGTSTLAKVDIYSSFDLLTWGNLEPKIIKEPVAAITGIYSDTASVVLEYEVTARTDSGEERYAVKECFRIKYSSSRMYLLNYERTMEAAFDPELFSVSQSEFKLGITSQTEVPYLVNEAGTAAAFVRNRELWSYNFAENTLVKVFGFRQNNSDFVRDSYDHHEVRLLRLDEGGDIDFMVYGYMNRGEYEGRMALVLYHYYRQEGRIEEQVYIPLEEPWQTLKEEVGEFAYRNSLDRFYFSLYDTLYVYNLTAKSLSVIAQGVADEELVFSVEAGYAAWANQNEEGIAEEICVLNLESGRTESLPASDGDTIVLLGEIDDNMICGYARTSDITWKADGTRIEPMYRITIVSSEGTVLKDYSPQGGAYVTGACVEGNVITLTLMTKEDGGLKEAGTDSILNRITEETEPLTVTRRVTELTLTEYYLKLPEAFLGNGMPQTSQTINTVITEDTTVRVLRPEEQENAWYTVSFGEAIGKYDTAGEAVSAADEAVGVVINRSGQIVWERGVKGTRAEIALGTISGDSVQSAMKQLFAARNVEVDTSGLSFADGTLERAVSQYLKAEFLELKGAALDQVLYYVYKKSPVIAFLEDDTAVVITAYDSQSITYQNPKTGKSIKLDKTDAQKLFEKAGNVFFSYIM